MGSGEHRLRKAFRLLEADALNGEPQGLCPQKEPPSPAGGVFN
ncbi:hypothetical protein MASR2M17_09870 [Aminivibrio sp.]